MVRSSAAPEAVASRAPRRSSTPPRASTSLGGFGCVLRSTALTRATSSRGLNGLGT